MKTVDVKTQAIASGFQDAVPVTVRPFDVWLCCRDASIAQGKGAPESIVYDPCQLLPNARTLWVLVKAHQPYDPWPESSLRVASHYPAKQSGYRAVHALADWLRKAGYAALADPPLPAKAAAVRAGLGKLGRNGLFLSDAYGSYVSLHLLLTDAVESNAQDCDKAVPCRGCGACERACPVGALADGVVDATRCLRHFMLSGETVPEAVRLLLGARLIGCEICQQCCPENRTAPQPVPLELQHATDRRGLLAMGSDTFSMQRKMLAEMLGSNVARSLRLTAAAALAAGNSGDRTLIPALEDLRKHEDSLIRTYAVWALERLGRLAETP